LAFYLFPLWKLVFCRWQAAASNVDLLEVFLNLRRQRHRLLVEVGQLSVDVAQRLLSPALEIQGSGTLYLNAAKQTKTDVAGTLEKPCSGNLSNAKHPFHPAQSGTGLHSW